MSLNWQEMTSTPLPVADHTITVVIGSLSSAFTFRVRRQPSSTRSIIQLGKVADRATLTFIVEDVTDYSATTNPRTVFTTTFTAALIMGIRQLVAGGTSAIPKPGQAMTFGSSVNSIVDTVDIAQNGEGTPDVFLVTCTLVEPEEVTVTGSQRGPKLAKSDEVPPWQMPADIVFETQVSEGMTLGFLYPTADLEGRNTYSTDQLRALGMASGDKLVAVENYAKDPFSSPPAMLQTTGTLKVTKSFLRAGQNFDVANYDGKVNEGDIELYMVGARVMFPKGTLCVGNVSVIPRLYKKQIPWFNKTKHPLNKTYGELFFGYSGAAANIVAFNSTGETILVQKPIYYLELSASFTYSPKGFGVWLANRGYTVLNPDKATKREQITDGDNGTTAKEGWISRDGKRSKDIEERIWRGFTNVYPSPKIRELLRQFIPENLHFRWATEDDDYGAVLR